MRAWTAPLALAACAVAPPSAPLTACDELARPPQAATGIAPLRPPGVARGQMDGPAAEAACRAAMAEHPAEPRFPFQLALALAQQLKTEEADAAFRRAAELGHAPAQFQ